MDAKYVPSGKMYANSTENWFGKGRVEGYQGEELICRALIRKRMRAERSEARDVNIDNVG